MSKAWIEQEHAFGNVSPFLQFQPSVHFPAFQVCIGRSIGCQSPHQTLACTLLLISDVTRLQVVEYTHICTFQNTYLQIQTLSLRFHVTVAPPCHASPLSWTTNSQCPGTTPISHRVSKWETHIFVIITHLGAQVNSWVCRGRRFDERETAALVLVVSRTWGRGGGVRGCEHMPFIIIASCSKLIQFTKGASVKFAPLINTALNTFAPPLV